MTDPHRVFWKMLYVTRWRFLQSVAHALLEGEYFYATITVPKSKGSMQRINADTAHATEGSTK